VVGLPHAGVIVGVTYVEAKNARYKARQVQAHSIFDPREIIGVANLVKVQDVNILVLLQKVCQDISNETRVINNFFDFLIRKKVKKQSFLKFVVKVKQQSVDHQGRVSISQHNAVQLRLKSVNINPHRLPVQNYTLHLPSYLSARVTLSQKQDPPSIVL
jgi:hypothetical protein